MKKSKLLFLLLLIISACSCDRPECQNTNPIFDQYAPGAKEYKSELMKQIKLIGPKNIRYWFDKSHTDSNKEYYELYVQGKGLCAKIIAENKSNRKQLSTGGYNGAELKGVAISAKQDTAGTTFSLENIDMIID